ncbi:MAG: PQQ-binding-like beta-propeller repeat protein, partial [Nitriliruptoraceae bacterium]|nr:PQQ-binding-like beta-propeller repeat protein [Nitriliruptoraceae bacterium]
MATLHAPPAGDPPGDAEVALRSAGDDIRPSSAATSAGCVRADGGACGPPRPDLADAVLATHLGDGAWLLAERDARVSVVELPAGTDPGRMRWHTTLDADAATAVALRETTPLGGARVRVHRHADRAYLGDGGGVTALDVVRGEALWRVDLEGSATAPAYRVWDVGGHLLVVGHAELLALDVDGAIRWREPRPAGDVQPIEDGIAIVGRDRISAFGVASPAPTWSIPHPAPGSRPAVGVVERATGPLVLDGARTLTLDASDGAVRHDHGSEAVATRTPDGTVVVIHWPDGDARTSTVRGHDPDGTLRWERDGPDVRCCELLLRPIGDGHVLAATLGRGRTDVGWVIDPEDGRTVSRVIRPTGVSPLPVAVARAPPRWRRGDGGVGARPGAGRRGLTRAAADAERRATPARDLGPQTLGRRPWAADLGP